MVRTLLFLLTAILGYFPISAQTIVNLASVSGTWTMAGSPYLVQTNLWVPPGQSLQIKEGVEVRFEGLYGIYAQGNIQIDGSADSRVLFRAKDTTGWHDDAGALGGWRGIRISPSATSTSHFRYCDFRDVKTGSSVAFPANYFPGFLVERSIAISNISLSHSQGSLFWFNAADAATVTIDSSSFFKNRTGYGGVVKAELLHNTTSIRRSKFYNNKGDNTVFMVIHNAVIEDNEFYNNEHGINAAAINAIDMNTVVVRRNKIHHNNMSNHGAIIIRAKNLDIDNNYICNNRLVDAGSCGIAEGGGGLHIQGYGTNQIRIRNNVIANNESAFTGGGIYLNGVKALIANNTIVNNSAASFGAATYAIGATDLHFRNNIIYGNDGRNGYDTAVDIVLWNGGNIRMDYNFIQSPISRFVYTPSAQYTVVGDTSHNIISSQPGFVSPTSSFGLAANAMTANFRLQPTSVAINRGDSSTAQCTQKDLAENSRVTSRVDMGAYESAVTQGANAVANTQALLLKAYPNPAGTSVQLSLPVAGGTVSLYNTTGALVWQQAVSATSAVIPVAELPTGVYRAAWIHDAQSGFVTVTVQH